MKSLVLSLMILAMAGPALAEERSIPLSELAGVSPETLREKLGLMSSVDFTPRLIAWQDDKRYEMLRPVFNPRSSICPRRPHFALSGSRRHPDSYLFIDGVLVATIAFTTGPVLPLTTHPKNALRFEEGVSSYLADIAAETADPDAVLTVSCPPEIKFQRPKPHPVEAVAQVAYVGFALVMFSPYLASNVVKGVSRHAAYDKSFAIMAGLQPGAVLEGGGEGFARAYPKQVQWTPSAYTPGYGVLTVDLGAAATSVMSGERKPRDRTTGEAANVGVRDGRVEWLTFDAGSAVCGPRRGGISSARPGCREGSDPLKTR